MRIILTLLGFAFSIAGIALTIRVFTGATGQWDSVGRVWFEWAPGSLQHAESVISRYIDPCGLIVALDCAPFLWHPVISTVLTWPASPVFLTIGLVLMMLGYRRRSA